MDVVEVLLRNDEASADADFQVGHVVRQSNTMLYGFPLEGFIMNRINAWGITGDGFLQ